MISIPGDVNPAESVILTVCTFNAVRMFGEIAFIIKNKIGMNYM